MTLPNRHHCNVQIALIYLLEGLCILKIIRYNCDLLCRHQKHVHISLFHAQHGHNIIELQKAQPSSRPYEYENKLGNFMFPFCGLQQGPPYFPTFKYQWGSLTIDRHAFGKSKTAFGKSVALTETRGKPFEVNFFENLAHFCIFRYL